MSWKNNKAADILKNIKKIILLFPLSSSVLLFEPIVQFDHLWCLNFPISAFGPPPDITLLQDIYKFPVTNGKMPDVKEIYHEEKMAYLLQIWCIHDTEAFDLNSNFLFVLGHISCLARSPACMVSVFSCLPSKGEQLAMVLPVTPPLAAHTTATYAENKGEEALSKWQNELCLQPFPSPS